ncbi:MAG: DNA repair protein RadA [Thermomicrobiales bacterium]|nr:DNA repair protein RadA [Thermomicrobiales bacterium]
MAKRSTTYVCQQCGAHSPAYLGRCPNCNSWNSMVETIEPKAQAGRAGARPALVPSAQAQRISEVEAAESQRIKTNIAELDRVLGGGLVPGSVVLVGGDPGIGKSTLVLQSAAQLGTGTSPSLYASGEESVHQIRLRAERLGVSGDNVLVVSESSLDEIIALAEQVQPQVLVVDSIQTATVDELETSAGSVGQVRESTARLIRWAKPRMVPVIIIGHVTKEGNIAGPRVLEHMVDAVLYLEGERFQQFRILRGVKNRFGSTDEVGVFEMAESGLQEVRNPSEAFLQERALNAAGSTVTVTLEGSRPILVEVQALTSQSVYGLPRRSANGFDQGRLQLLVAVLQKRAGLNLAEQDVYTNAVGGLKIAEPAADLAVSTAIASSLKDKLIDPRTVVIGEVGLSGEVRSVSQLDRRLLEASRLGFSRAIVPASIGRRTKSMPGELDVIRVGTLSEAIREAVG